MSNEPFDDIHETRELPFGLFSKSPFLRGMIVNTVDKDQQQVAEDAKDFLKLAGMCVALWWMHTTIAIPLFVGMEANPIMAVLWQLFTLALLPFAGVIGIFGIIHAGWYVRKRRTANQTAGGARK